MELNFLIPWAAIPLRLILGIIFVIQGWPKIKNLERAATYLLKFGIPLPQLAAIIVAILEFFGGIALVIGFETRVIAGLLTIQMIVATYLKKTKMKESYEYELVLVAALLTLFLLGAGTISVDHTFGWRLG